MFKFILKTTVITTLAVGAALAAFGPNTMVRWAKDSKDAVAQHLQDFQGMSSELRSIEDHVTKLDGEILRLKEIALKEELAIEELDRDVGERQKTVEHLRSNLERADSMLETELTTFKIRGITYSRDEVEKDVEEKLRLYKVQRATLSQIKETLNTRQSALELAQENVDRGQVVREEMLCKIHFLEAQLEQYEARQVYAEAVASDFDSREFNTEIGEARQLMAQFEKKLEVKNRMLDDRMRITTGEGSVAGIDYSAPQEKSLAVREELARALSGEDFLVTEAAALVQND
jgi:chromosome segregation ATPase